MHRTAIVLAVGVLLAPCGPGQAQTPNSAPPTAGSAQQQGSAATSAPPSNAPAANAPAANQPAPNAPPSNEPAANAPATNAPATTPPATNAPATNPTPTKPPAPTPPAGGAPTQAAAPAQPQKYRNKDGELRLSQLLGAAVSNDQNQAIGTISDVLLGQDNKAVKAVLSVGGFLGVGSRLVEVPFGELQIGADKIVLPGATKVSLENLSAYQSP